MTSYYLRKFVEDRQDILHALLPEFRGAITLDRLFTRMSRRGKSGEQIQVIESLVNIHKQLTKRSPPDSTEVLNLDKRLLLSLGIEENMNQPDTHDSSITVAGDCVEILNSLHTRALFFLGDKIGTKYMIETRPVELWCERFKINQNQKISYRGSLDERLSLQQVRCFESWVKDFAERCTDIMTAFEGDIERKTDPENEALLDW